MLSDSKHPEGDISLITFLREKYGELLTLSQLAEVFNYSSVAALRKARSRGTFPVKLYKMTGKSGQYAKATEVAAAINRMQEVES